MTTLRSLLVVLPLASDAAFAGPTRGTAIFIGEKRVDPRSQGTTVGNVIINVPIASAPKQPGSPFPPSSSGNPAGSPVSKRLIMVEIGDFIYDWEQVKGPTFVASPDDRIDFTEDKGKYIVTRNNARYEFVVVEFRRK
jgi:hypothetical protein